ncbi:amino acid-binding protein [Burkholderia sp. Ac-20353]|uniref:amino acid-binding protein n=1 Tax=Burkholderia sp. Ac-20353 TaxID=2703894 RepID=UPI00197BCE0D|nr:amino acid-binding protein [Burkholderia sp. Ac-20353]MBN3790464.1 amino acid-binding protein [Burkholderia sp. Ac-20353]
MHVKLAYAESVAAAVAMLAACSKKSDDGAGREAAASAAPLASDVRAVRIGHAAPLTGSIAHPGKDNENGAGLAIDEINTHGLTIDGRPVRLERVAANDAQQGSALANHALHALRAKRFTVADDATAYGQGLADEFANTVEATGGQIHAVFTYDEVYVSVDAMKRANSTDTSKGLAAMPSTDCRGVIGHIAFAPNGDPKERAMTLYDFKEAKNTVLDVVTM